VSFIAISFYYRRRNEVLRLFSLLVQDYPTSSEQNLTNLLEGQGVVQGTIDFVAIQIAIRIHECSQIFCLQFIAIPADSGEYYAVIGEV